MGKILLIKDEVARREKRSDRRRHLARLFIHQASSILEGLSENDKRIGWLLSDCAELLEGQKNNDKSVVTQ